MIACHQAEVFDELDVKLNGGKPPALEYILVRSARSMIMVNSICYMIKDNYKK